jgi:hypothetical protein
MQISALQPNIIFRLVLAKTLFKSGLEFCNTKVDDYNFSHGLIALHDALDNFTGAIVTHLNITLPQEGKFITTLNLIQEYEKKANPSFILISRNELVQLNTLRNNIKHQGIIPNIKHTKTLIAPILAFFREYSQRYFNLEWDFISLVDLIKKDTVKAALKKVEDLINRAKYKEALNEMAIIKFQVFDEQLMRIKFDPKWHFGSRSEKAEELRKSRNIFLEHDDDVFSDLYDRTKFLERGINRTLMDKFEALTAKVGINNLADWKYLLKHDRNWGKINWTREISIFCFDFLIDAIIKYQGRDYEVKQKWIYEYPRIRAKDDLKLYDKDHKLVYTMKKGEEREAFIFGRVNCEWEIFDTHDRMLVLYKENGEREIVGFFDDGDESKIEFLEIKRFAKDENGNVIPIE